MIPVASGVLPIDLPTSRNSTKFGSRFAAPRRITEHPSACERATRVWFETCNLLLIGSPREADI
jgi:hypothetical protein